MNGSPAHRSAAANARISALAAHRGVHRAFAWLHLHEPRILSWQREITSIPAPPFHEAARGGWVRDRFAELGLQHPHIDAEGNALAVLPGADPANTPAVLISAHLDTVFLPSSNPPAQSCSRPM